MAIIYPSYLVYTNLVCFIFENVVFFFSHKYVLVNVEIVRPKILKYNILHLGGICKTKSEQY